MRTITYKLTPLLDLLATKRKEHKLTYTEDYKSFKLDIQYLNLEQGLHFISAKIELLEDVCFTQIPDLTKDWTIIYILENNIVNCYQSHKIGIYTSFNDSNFKTTFSAGNTLSFFSILMSNDYLKVYKIQSIFENFHLDQAEMNYQVMSTKFREQLDKLKNRKDGMIKIKKKLTDLIKIYYLEKEVSSSNLFSNIDNICEICLQQKLSLNIYLSSKLNLDEEYINKYFYEYFKVSPYKFYYEYRIGNFRKLLKNKENLNKILQLSIKEHYPCLELLSEKFDLGKKQIKKLFVEEFGQSIYIYYRNLRLASAKEYLQNKKMKVSQVSQILGYSHPSKLTLVFNKYEGYNPKVLLKIKD